MEIISQVVLSLSIVVRHFGARATKAAVFCGTNFADWRYNVKAFIGVLKTLTRQKRVPERPRTRLKSPRKAEGKGCESMGA